MPQKLPPILPKHLIRQPLVTSVPRSVPSSSSNGVLPRVRPFSGIRGHDRRPINLPLTSQPPLPHKSKTKLLLTPDVAKTGGLDRPKPTPPTTDAAGVDPAVVKELRSQLPLFPTQFPSDSPPIVKPVLDIIDNVGSIGCGAVLLLNVLKLVLTRLKLLLNVPA